MPERVLIVGAGGFIGRALSAGLVAQGKAVRAVTRDPWQTPPAGIEAIACDGRNPARITPLLEGCNAVAYLAASSTPGSSAGRPLIELDGNLRPLLALLEAMQARPGLPLLYFSSAGALYGERNEAAFGEDDPLRPKSYHGAGKAAAEQFIGAWCRQFGASATVLRPSNVYGPGQPARAGFGIVPYALGAIRRGEALTVWGDGSAVRDYLYIDDLVALALAVLRPPMPTGLRVFNAASGEAVSLDALFALMQVASGQPLRRQYQRGRAVDAGRVAVDATLARRTFGWTPAVTLSEGLKRTWRWLNTAPR